MVPAPLLRREFTVGKAVRSARFYGTGLGYFELYVNGSRVGEDYLTPNQTNYDRRPKLGTRPIVVTDPFREYTVMYVSYDLKPLLREGANAVGAILGNGFYDMVEYWAALGYGTPRFMGQIEIEYEDGTPFVPVGMNLCFERFSGDDAEILAIYRRWFRAQCACRCRKRTARSRERMRCARHLSEKQRRSSAADFRCAPTPTRCVRFWKAGCRR